MPVSCCAPGCTKRFVKGADIRFFRFPVDGERRKAWQWATKRMQIGDQNKLWEPSSHDRICSLHFIGGQPSLAPDHPDYVPSVFQFTPVTKTTPNRVGRYERIARRRLSLTPIVDDAFISREADIDIVASALLDLAAEEPLFKEAGTDPDPDPVHQKLEELENDHKNLRENHMKLQKDYQCLLSENRRLEEELQRTQFSYKNLDNSKLSSLTGLPSVAVFHWVLTLCGFLYKGTGKLCAGNQLLLVLMKLRLNLTNKDLAIRFNISPTQVSKTLSRCIPLISEKLRFLIKWPSKGTILKNMPKSFRRHYKKCRVIIDCSEVFIQRPSNLDARAKTWSNYKHHNTLKFLIGITPYGAVSFLSKCWGGRVSDKEITAKSGFYEKLEYGDLVLADRGFLIAEELAVHGATLAIPPFGRGKKQFSQKEVEFARQLSRSRIHVERAIERVKNFQILKQIMPLSLMPHADDILEICGALTNLMPKLVK